jgi:hypothetical protein
MVTFGEQYRPLTDEASTRYNRHKTLKDFHAEIVEGANNRLEHIGITTFYRLEDRYIDHQRDQMWEAHREEQELKHRKILARRRDEIRSMAIEQMGVCGDVIELPDDDEALTLAEEHLLLKRKRRNKLRRDKWHANAAL